MAETMARRPMIFARLRTVGRVAVVTLVWLGLSGLVTGIVFAPRGLEEQPTFDDVIGFGLSVAIAGAVAAATAFAVGGKVRWGRELAIAAVVAGALVAMLIVCAFWLDPSVARLRMGRWEFERYRQDSRRWSEQILGFHLPLGLIVGALFGLIAGSSARPSRRHPRAATIVPLAILFSLALEPVRLLVSAGTTFLSKLIRFNSLPWSLVDDAISQDATLLGALLGALLAGLLLYAARSREARTQPAGAVKAEVVP